MVAAVDFEGILTNEFIRKLAVPVAIAAVYPYVFAVLAIRLRRLSPVLGSRSFFQYVASKSVSRSFMFVAVLVTGLLVTFFLCIIGFGVFDLFDRLRPETSGWIIFSILALAPLGGATLWLWTHQDAEAPGFDDSGKTSYLVRKLVYQEQGFF